MKNKLNYNLFRHNYLVSLLFFLFGTFFFALQFPGYNFQQLTLSKIIMFLDKREAQLFALIFFAKGLIDLTFISYVFKIKHIKAFSYEGVCWLLTPVFFAAMGVFPCNTQTFYHRMCALAYIAIWLALEIKYSRANRLMRFIIICQIAFAALYLMQRRLNAFLEIELLVFNYLWVELFLSKSKKRLERELI